MGRGLLAALLSLDRLFQPDYEDGGLDLIALSPLPLELAVLAKCAAHWVSTGLPLALVSPLLALVVDLDTARDPDSWSLSLLIGTPALSLIGSVAAALTSGARRQGVLLSLLVLPLYVPPLIFGAGAVEASALRHRAARRSLDCSARSPWRRCPCARGRVQRRCGRRSNERERATVSRLTRMADLRYDSCDAKRGYDRDDQPLCQSGTLYAAQRGGFALVQLVERCRCSPSGSIWP